MTLFPIHNYFIFNGEIKPVSEFIPSENEGGIYEVLRVEKGIPLFIEDHLLRFKKSALIAQKTISYSDSEIKMFVKTLILKNKLEEGNILISCKTNLKIFPVSYKYPTGEMFKNGVKCGILKAERENPNAKVFQTLVRQKANKLISENDFYEVLLVDNLGRVTEGSRSNLFFVKENKIITPSGNNVLLGITRHKTIQLIQLLGYNFIEKEVSFNELSSFDALFITGTSPNILPVKQVGEILFNPQNVILQALMNGYNTLIDEYVRGNIFLNVD